jgi:hypothetical protein
MAIFLYLIAWLGPFVDNFWALNALDETLVSRGFTQPAPGVSGESIIFDGEAVIELKSSEKIGNGPMTLSLWFNPYELNHGQQILIGKNRYSRNERQWSLTIEPDGRLKAHLRQADWRTIECQEPLQVGHWYQVVLVMDDKQCQLFLNGKIQGRTTLDRPIAATEVPITIGGIWDSDKIVQGFCGALDECVISDRLWTAEEILKRFQPVSAVHTIPTLESLPLWDSTAKFPRSSELIEVTGSQFYTIKKERPDDDGCLFTLGVGLAWHKGRLYASYGFNQGEENTATEEAHVRISDDGGKAWSKPTVLDAGEGELAVSHGVFLSHKGKLWAFMGAFYEHPLLYHRVHTRAYHLDEPTGKWLPHGSIVEDGFWPMQEPQKMDDGNWIMAGFRVSGPNRPESNLPAVAISDGENFERWKLIVIPAAPTVRKNLWGESTVIVDGNRILNIARYGAKPIALLSMSQDYGQTWTPTTSSNLPMATSKPYAGTLSNGQHYLICTTTADTGGTRSPLTIALTKPGEFVFSRVLSIRTSVSEKTTGVSSPQVDFSYPYAVEHAGYLYIGYTHKSHAANELAVIPIKSLEIDR